MISNENNHIRPKDVYEIFEEFVKASKKAEKIAVLQKYKDNKALMDLLKGTFDDRIKWLIPAGKPPYTPNKPESTPSTLLRKYKDFVYFANGGPGTKMPSFKREKLFITLIESIHPADAELVISMINKKPSIKGLTKKLVEEAFPGWVS